MLARVTGGKSGIVEYLVNGMKSGRELDRNTLDNRICLEGNLALTDQIINSMDSSENYLHITLSFTEKELTNEKIGEVYEAYRDKLFSAYESEEFNIFAEIHQPKVKSYKDKQTGETVERLPHVHIVIPKKNLVTEKVFNPFGDYKSGVKYQSAIQESINRDFKLSSPFDSQRPLNFEGNAKFISRYKGDTFKGANSKLKTELFDLVISTGIKSKAELVSTLSRKGEVSFGKLDTQDEYIKFKPEGQSRNVRLTEVCFRDRFLETRELTREKPTDKQVYSLVDDWVNNVSHEKKLIHQASPKTRKEYYSLNKTDKKEFLDEQRQQFTSKHFPERGRTASNQLSIKRIGSRRFADIPNGLPSLPELGVVLSRGKRSGHAKGILSGNEKRDLVATRTDRNSQLRRSDDGRKRGRITSFDGFKVNAKLKAEQNSNDRPEQPQTLSESLLSEHLDNSKKDNELRFFRVLRRNLKADNLLERLSESHGINPDDYQVIRAKDGSQRIKKDRIAYNVSDFCTKHMQLSWDETKEILTETYSSQAEKKQHQQISNSISFVSRQVTNGYLPKSQLAMMNESVRNFKYLQKLEQHGANQMFEKLQKYAKVFDSEKNSISANDSTSMNDVVERLKRSREVEKQLQGNLKDIVVNKDVKKKEVNFLDKESGKVLFTNTSSGITFADRKPDIKHVGAAMELAEKNDYGKLNITGSKDFKQQVLEVAVAKNLNVVFADKKMQADFVAAKKLNSEDVNSIQDGAVQNTDKSSNAANDSSKETKKEASTGVIVKHGEANYHFKEDATKSYFVELDNGAVKWGVGLKDVIEKSGADVGDEVRLNVLEKRAVTVTEKIKDENGQTVETISKEASRNDWGLDMINKANAEEDKANVTYKWDDTNKKLEVLVDGKHLSTLEDGALEKLKESNSFLQHYPVEDLKSGKLDISKAPDSEQLPVVYDKNGEMVTRSSVEKPEKQEQASADPKKEQTFAVTYNFNKETNKMDVQINGKQPSSINENVLEGIKDNDSYLKNFTKEEIKSGSLEISQAGQSHAIEKTYNQRGEVSQAHVEKQAPVKMSH